MGLVYEKAMKYLDMKRDEDVITALSGEITTLENNETYETHFIG